MAVHAMVSQRRRRKRSACRRRSECHRVCRIPPVPVSGRSGSRERERRKPKDRKPRLRDCACCGPSGLNANKATRHGLGPPLWVNVARAPLAGPVAQGLQLGQLGVVNPSWRPPP